MTKRTKPETWDIHPQVAELADRLIAEHPTCPKGHLRSALMAMAGMAAALGYQIGQEDLRATFIPVKFTKDSIGLAALPDDEAEALLKDFGMRPGE